MKSDLFLKVHGKLIAKIFKEPATDKKISSKLAEYSAVTCVPVLNCYEMYLEVVGPSEFVSNRLAEWKAGKL